MHHTDVDLDPVSRRLTGPKGSVELQSKTAALLAHLIAHPEEAISKDVLLREIWADAFVTEGSLTRAMSVLRKELHGVGSHRFFSALGTVRGFGYRLEADPAAASGPSAWAQPTWVEDRLSNIRKTELSAACVGRRREADQLLAQVDTAIRRKQPQLSFLSGSPGIGKTFLLRELGTQLERHEILVGWARAEGSVHDPLGPWRAWLDKLRFTRSDVPTPNSIKAITQSLATRGRTAPRTEPSRNRVELWHNLTAYLRACSAHSPLVLVLEDAHLCDATTFEALLYVVEHIDPAQINIVISFRNFETGKTTPQKKFIQELRRSRVAHAPIELAGLDEPNAATLLERVSGKSFSEELVRQIHKQTGGNPFFLEEIARNYIDDQDAPHEIEKESATHQPHNGLGMLLQNRIDALPESTQRVLGAGAVLGRKFSASAAAQVVGRPIAEIASDVATAQRDRLIVRAAEGTWAFQHDTVRDSVLATLSKSERCEMHGRAAHMLEQHLGESPPPNTLSEVAYHYAEAGAAGPPDRGLDFCARAARANLESLAFKEAVEYFERSIEASDSLANTDDVQKAWLLADLAEATFHAFDDERYTKAAWNAINVGKELGLADVVGETAWKMSRRRLANIAAKPEGRIAVLEWALPRVDENDCALRAKILASLSVDRYWSGEFAQIRELNAESLELVRRAGDRDTEFRILRDRWGLFLHPEDAEVRYRALDDAFAVADELNAVPLKVLALGWQMSDAVEAGDRAKMDKTLSELDKLANYTHDPLCQSTVFSANALKAVFVGELDHAEMLADEEFAFRTLGTNQNAALPFRAIFLYMLRLAQGRVTELEPLLMAAVSAYPRAVGFRLCLALCYAESSRESLAHTTLTEVLDQFRDQLLRRDANYQVRLGMAADVAARTGHEEAAKWLLPLLEPHRGRQLCMESTGTLGFADRYLALCERVIGQTDKAEASLRRALELESGFGSVVGIAYAATDLWELLKSQNTRSEEAKACLATARELAQAHGIDRLAPRLG